MYGNVLLNVRTGLLLGGGRRHRVYNNHFDMGVAVGTAAVHMDDRGLHWQTAYCQPGGVFQQQLEAVHYQRPPWSTHYPFIADIMAVRPTHTTNHPFLSPCTPSETIPHCISIFNVIARPLSYSSAP